MGNGFDVYGFHMILVGFTFHAQEYIRRFPRNKATFFKIIFSGYKSPFNSKAVVILDESKLSIINQKRVLKQCPIS